MSTKPYTYQATAGAPTDEAVLGAYHSAPGFAVPDGACDCHVHVFGPREKYPLANDRTFAPGIASLDDVLAMHQRLGITRVVIVQASPQGFDNACMEDALQELQRRGRQARGVAVVRPDTGRDVLEGLHAKGVRGLRVNLQSYGQTDPAVAAARLSAAAALAAQLGWHIQTYTTLEVIAALAEHIRRLPTPLVVDHFGLADPARGLDQHGLPELLALVRQGKVYVKLSAPYRFISRLDGEDMGPVTRALIDAHPERMLWGTDWPHTGPWPGRAREREGAEPFHPVDDGLQLRILARHTSAEERQRILVDNPRRLYAF